MQAGSPEDEFRRTLEQVHSATDRMMAGDSGPWKALLSRREDVVLLGAFGGYVRDRAEVDARFDRTASAYSAGRTGYEHLGPGSAPTWPAPSTWSATTGCGWPGVRPRPSPTA